MDATTIRPGQRYAWLYGHSDIGHGTDQWLVSTNDTPKSWTQRESARTRHPIVEPERLHEIPVGWTVLNVATGEQFEWDVYADNWFRGQVGAWNVTPLLALVATPEESA